MKITMEIGQRNHVTIHEYVYQKNHTTERPVALDVLLQAQTNKFPELAYRYGCRNALCGICTIEVNGKPKLACRTKLREGDHLAALSNLPLLKDFVVNRAAINQQLRHRLPITSTQNQTNDSQADNAYNSLNRCIECYACLNDCPLHEKNDLQDNNADYPFANPYSLLKIQRVTVDASASSEDKKQALALAKDMGLETCSSCKGCKCGIGINLKKEVIHPLLEASLATGSRKGES